MCLSRFSPDLGLVRARAPRATPTRREARRRLATFARKRRCTCARKRELAARGRLGELVYTTTPPPCHAWGGARLRAFCFHSFRHDADPTLFPIIRELFDALAALPKTHEAAEVLCRRFACSPQLGFDAGRIPSGASPFAPDCSVEITKNRTSYITRINHGIDASGLDILRLMPPRTRRRRYWRAQRARRERLYEPDALSSHRPAPRPPIRAPWVEEHSTLDVPAPRSGACVSAGVFFVVAFLFFYISLGAASYFFLLAATRIRWIK